MQVVGLFTRSRCSTEAQFAESLLYDWVVTDLLLELLMGGEMLLEVLTGGEMLLELFIG